MKTAGVLIAATFLLGGAPSALLAQAGGPKVSLTGGIDYSRMTEDDGFLGAGAGGSVGLQLHVSDRTSLDVEIVHETHVRDIGVSAVAFDSRGGMIAIPYTRRNDGAATFLLAAVSHAFGTGRVRPVLWGGGGLMWHGGTTTRPLAMPQAPSGYTLQRGDPEFRVTESTSAATIDGGGGVDVRIAPRWHVRPFAGLRLVNTGNVGPKYIVRTGARIAYGW